MPSVEPRPPFRSQAQAQGPICGPARRGLPGEAHLSTLAPDPFARLTLALMRFHFQTFTTPETQGWLLALGFATTHVGSRAAGPLCYDLVALVQALRAARSSGFAFNSEGCACCRVWLTPEERRLMELIDALRQSQIGRARTLVQMLCDGVPSDDLMAMAEIYLRRHAPEFTHSIGTAPAKTSRNLG